MSRGWNEFVALLGDGVPGGVLMLGLLLFLLTMLASLLWYYWPAWLPSRRLRAWRERRAHSRTESDGRFRPRWDRFRLPRLRFDFRWPGRWWRRLRWRRWWRRRRDAVEPPVLPDDQLPDLPATVLALGADELAAAGRYAEAVRERLRAILRDLVERGVIVNYPGWTVHELSRTAARNRPPIAAPLTAAADLFGEIWYGMRPATSDDDQLMRVRAEQVRAELDPPATAVTPAEVTR
jgi:hypothetical protein